MATTRTKVVPSGGGAGAFVENVDLRRLRAPTAAKLREALGEYGVLFFRDQHLTTSQHLAVAEKFGDVNVNRFFKAVDGYPKVAQVLKEAHHERNIGGGWHTDHSYDTAPAMGSMLLAQETPPSGGDTLFASMFKAYETLSDGLKQMLESLRAEHSSRHVFGAQARARRGDIGDRVANYDEALQDATHPVIIKHPISGKKSLYVNPGFTVRFEGWTDQESAPLLQMLYAHAARPEHTFRFNWAPGSIAFWDNRATWHYALNDYPGQRRLMHRITVEGCQLQAA
jgi:taurine dioxygenase